MSFFRLGDVVFHSSCGCCKLLLDVDYSDNHLTLFFASCSPSVNGRVARASHFASDMVERGGQWVFLRRG